jgi:hypothetical protein
VRLIASDLVRRAAALINRSAITEVEAAPALTG